MRLFFSVFVIGTFFAHTSFAACSSSDGGVTYACTGTTESQGIGCANTPSGVEYCLSGDATFNVNAGAIIQSTTGSTIYDGFRIGTGGLTGNLIINNDGTIRGRGNNSFESVAIQLATSGASGNTLNTVINNNGLISSSFRLAIQAQATGDLTLNNNASGQVTSTSGTWSIRTFPTNPSGLRGVDRIVNAGTITRQLLLRAQSVVVINSGTITGDINGSSGTTTSVSSITNQSSGVITGNITTNAQGDTVTNSGTINGSVNVGNGNNTVTNNTGGTITDTITAGTGDDTVTNSGTITGDVNVSNGTNNITNNSGATITGAISTGTGSDTITNSGTIGGNITTNDGNDTITLASPYAGNINMGSGTDDTLNLSGSQVYSFTPAQLTNVDVVNLKGGTTFNMNGQYSFGKSLTIEENAKLTLSTGSKLTTLGNTTINSGTLESAGGATIEIAGPYQQTSSGTLNVHINATNNTVPSGLNVTGGNATLAGTLNVTDVGDASFARGDRFDVVVSDSNVIGRFDVVNAPSLAGLGGLQWVQFNPGSKLTLVIEYQLDCGANSLSPNSLSVCSAMNIAVVSDNTSNDCRSVIDRLRSISGTPLFHEELMAISPQGYGYVMDSNLLFQQTALMNLGSNSVARHIITKDKQKSFWMHLVHNDQRKDDSFYFDEWKNKRNGVFIGNDYHPSTEKLLRVSLGYTDQKLTIPASFRNESHAGHLMILGRQDLMKSLYLQASAAYEHGRHAATRHVSCDKLTRTPKGEFATHTMAGRVELGGQFALKEVKLNPWSSLMHQRFISTHQREKEGGDANLEIEQMRQQAMLHQVGLRASTAISVMHIGVLKPYVELAHQKDMKRMGNSVTSSILGVPFTIQTMGNQTSNQIAGGFQFELSNNTIIHADYLYREIDNATKEHQAMIGGKIWM